MCKCLYLHLEKFGTRALTRTRGGWAASVCVWVCVKERVMNFRISQISACVLCVFDSIIKGFHPRLCFTALIPTNSWARCDAFKASTGCVPLLFCQLKWSLRLNSVFFRISHNKTYKTWTNTTLNASKRTHTHTLLLLDHLRLKVWECQTSLKLWEPKWL